MPHARRTDPRTSHEAASSVKNLTDTKRAIVLLVTAEPMTDDTLVHVYQTMARLELAPSASESGIRSRRAELVRDGLLIDSGARQKLSSGRNAIVWAVA